MCFFSKLPFQIFHSLGLKTLIAQWKGSMVTWQKCCSWVQMNSKSSTTNHIPKCAAQTCSSRFRHATRETSLGSHQMCKSLNCSGPRGRNTKGHISSDALELIITAHRVENWTSSVFSVSQYVIISIICILWLSITASSLCCKATLVGPRLMQPQNVNNASEMCPFFCCCCCCIDNVEPLAEMRR